MSPITILIYVLLIYLIFRSFVMNRSLKKYRELNECLSMIDQEEQFFEKIDAFIPAQKDPEIISRAETIRLYGVVLHGRFDEFEDTLNKIDVNALIQEKRGISIEQEEVSFFYLYLIIPNVLWSKEKNDLRKKLSEKMAPYSEKLNDQLVYQLSQAFDSFYEGTGDRGLAFDQKVMNGDYGDYRYAKNLIGIYKDLANAMLARLYQDEGNEEKLQECSDLLKTFDETHVGHRWISSLGVKMPAEEGSEEAAEDASVEEKAEKSDSESPEAAEEKDENKDA